MIPPGTRAPSPRPSGSPLLLLLPGPGRSGALFWDILEELLEMLRLETSLTQFIFIFHGWFLDYYYVMRGIRCFEVHFYLQIGT